MATHPPRPSRPLDKLLACVLLASLRFGVSIAQDATEAGRFNLAPNGSFEADQQRLGGWTHLGVMPLSEEYRLEIVSDVAKQGKRSLRISPGPFAAEPSVRGRVFYADYNGGEGQRIQTSDGGVTGARTIALRLDLNVASIEAAVWVRRSSADEVKFSAVWTTRRNRRPVVEIHRDTCREPSGQDEGWERYALCVPRPAEAIQVQLVVQTAGHEPVYLDAVQLFFHRRPETRLLVNQLGFTPCWQAKRIILQSTEPWVTLPDARVVDRQTFREVARIPWSAHGYVPELDYYYWSADISDLTTEGAYSVTWGEGRGQGDSAHFEICPDVVLRQTGRPAWRFYLEQRCGCVVPGVHAACHLDDGKLPDGTWRDLTGGWHDAGDYNKYNGLAPEAVHLLALAYHRQAPLFDRWDENDNGVSDILDEADWGAQWLVKMLDVESLKLRDRVFSGYRYWGPPETETDNQPSSGDERLVGSAAGDRSQLVGAFAWLGACLQRTTQADFALRGRRYTQLAERLAAVVEPELLTLQGLHEGTGRTEYSDRARRRAAVLLKGGPDAALPHFGELARYAIAVDDASLRARLQPTAQTRVQQLTALCRGPFLVAHRRTGEGQLAYCREVNDVNDWYVGETAYRLEAAIDGLLAAQLGIAGGRILAEHQLNWLFGCNPAGVSLMEGVGDHFVPGYHHRYNTIAGNPRGAVTGAILNGFVRAFPHVDRPWLDLYPEPNADYHTNEPWLLQNNRWLEILAWW